jgi:zinc protease
MNLLKRTSAKEINFTLPLFSRYTLSNGLEVYFIKKTELPIVRLKLLINSGSRFDPLNKRGLSNLLSMCIDEGAGDYDSLQLSDEFEFLGVHFSVHSDSDNTILSLQVLDEKLDPALKLFSSIILSPHLKEDDFLREKRKVLTHLKQLEDDPEYLADTTFDFLVLGEKNPYSFPTIGTEKKLQLIAVENIREFYNNYISPNNSALIVVGNIEERELINKLGNNLGNWKPNEVTINKVDQTESSASKVYIVNKKDSVQTEIRTGHISINRNDVDYFQRLLLNTILGGQFTSRINLNLREKHGYTYGARSYFNYYKEAAYFGVSTSVGIENTANALREIYNELKKIKEGVTEEELDFAKSSITKRYPLNFETYSQIASNISSKIIYNLPDNYFDTYIERVNAVKKEEVNNTADAFIKADKLITVLSGDSKKIEEQIKDSDYGEIIKIEYEKLFINSISRL